MSELPLDSIVVEDRHRRDLGDLAPLSASIRESGLLQPVVVTESGRLIAGQRRLAACRLLGWPNVPVTVIAGLSHASQLLAAERDENICRLDMKRSEQVALGVALEELERPKAAERKAASQPQPGERVGDGNSSPPTATGATRDAVGRALGMSGQTYERAKKVVSAAESGDPVGVAAREEMDRTGSVNGALRKLNGEDTERKRQRLDPESRRGQIVHGAAADRLSKLCSGLDGWAMGLTTFDVDAALQAAKPTQVEEWSNSLSQGISALRRLHTQLREAA